MYDFHQVGKGGLVVDRGGDCEYLHTSYLLYESNSISSLLVSDRWLQVEEHDVLYCLL